MPELPEVETIKQSLKKMVVGQTIQEIAIRLPKLFRGDRKDVIGSKIEQIERRAKMLIWKLSNKKFLLCHLKMTGQLLYDSKDHKQIAGGGHPDSAYLKIPPHEFTHVIFTLDKGNIYFNDLRQFGWIKVLDKEGLNKEVINIGPEVDWTEFTFEYFVTAMSRKSKTKIKTVLMDQSLIAGIGNIYSDEILFKSSILPNRPVKDLSEKELRSIYDNIKPVFELAMKHGGTSLRDYRRLDGSQGDFLHFANVYHRNGKPCRVCGMIIKRIVINGRSAHFCPSCQQ